MRSVLLVIITILTLGNLTMLALGSCVQTGLMDAWQGPQCQQETISAAMVAALPDDISIPASSILLAVVVTGLILSLRITPEQAPVHLRLWTRFIHPTLPRGGPAGDTFIPHLFATHDL